MVYRNTSRRIDDQNLLVRMIEKEQFWELLAWAAVIGLLLLAFG
jgi:hypothetical protein